MAQLIRFDLHDFLNTYGIIPLRNSVAITGITDNGDKTYTVLTPSTKAFDVTNQWNLPEFGAVTLAGINSDFNGNFEIINIVENVSFDLKRKSDATDKLNKLASGYTIPGSFVGATWTNLNPLYDYDRLDFLNVRKDEYSHDLKRRFPLVFTIEDADYHIDRKQQGYYDFTIFNLKIFFAETYDSDDIITDYYSKYFNKFTDLILKFINNIESLNVGGLTTTNELLRVDLLQFSYKHERELMITGGEDFDCELTSTILTIKKLVIKNAGILCYS